MTSAMLGTTKSNACAPPAGASQSFTRGVDLPSDRKTQTLLVQSPAAVADSN